MGVSCHCLSLVGVVILVGRILIVNGVFSFLGEVSVPLNSALISGNGEERVQASAVGCFPETTLADERVHVVLGLGKSLSGSEPNLTSCADEPTTPHHTLIYRLPRVSH
jgi:hypothetical protein